MKLYLVEDGVVFNFKKSSKDYYVIKVSDIMTEHNINTKELSTVQNFIIRDEIENKLKKLNNLKKCERVYLYVDTIHTSFIDFIQKFILENKIKIDDFEIFRRV